MHGSQHSLECIAFQGYGATQAVDLRTWNFVVMVLTEPTQRRQPSWTMDQGTQLRPDGRQMCSQQGLPESYERGLPVMSMHNAKTVTLTLNMMNVPCSSASALGHAATPRQQLRALRDPGDTALFYECKDYLGRISVLLYGHKFLLCRAYLILMCFHTTDTKPLIYFM